MPTYTVREVIDLYLEECRMRVSSGTLSAQHYRRSEDKLRAFKKLFGRKKVTECIKGDLSRFLAAHPSWKNPHSRIDAIGVVVTCFRWAEDAGYIDHCPYRRVPRLCGTPRPREAMTEAEYRAIMAAAKEGRPREWRGKLCPARKNFRRQLWFLWHTGARTCEAREARWDELDWQAGIIRLAKHKTARATGTDRIIPLSNMVLRYLRWVFKCRLPGQEYIFVNLRGHQIDKTNINMQFRRYAKRAGLRKEISPYSCRHGFVTRALESGLGERQVADAVGQRSTRFVEWYSRTLRSKTTYLRGVANAVGRPGSPQRNAPPVNGQPVPVVMQGQDDALPPAPDATPLDLPQGLTYTQRRVMTVVSKAPRSWAEIAAASGYVFDRPFKQEMRNLVKLGLLVREDGDLFRLP